MGSLYGNHTVLLITKSSTLILSNTTQVNFNTKCSFACTAYVKAQLEFKSTCFAFDGICVFYSIFTVVPSILILLKFLQAN